MADSTAQRALIVLKDANECAFLERELSVGGRVVESASDALVGLGRAESFVPDVILLDLELATEHEFIDQVRRRMPHTVIITIHDALALEQEVNALQRGALQQGALRGLTRPVDPEALRLVVQRSAEIAMAAREGATASQLLRDVVSAPQFGDIIGAHPLMQRLYNRVKSAATSKATVLIDGETGTGKELVAAAIHKMSLRSHGPFVRLNCAALAESVLESELFGHERGSFTGAAGRRKGRFEQAAGGTLFLDELSEMPPSVQVKLLRFLQEREFERVGGNETIKVDVRVVAATNRDLKLMVSEGTFREDLYYRLRVVVLDVPPLRARRSDIPLLSNYFLRQFNEEHERNVTGFTETAREAMLDYPWPGNVRELQHAVEQAVVLCQSEKIDAADLSIEAPSAEAQYLRLMIPGLTMVELERYAILRTLEALDGSTSKAAASLGVSRRVIQYRLQEWGLAGYGQDGGQGESEAPPPIATSEAAKPSPS
ncbi:MAG: DNA-binding NtrC family response regulator [Polyangiales bacterium]|jgi:DNA-binding NtrC family response regulator